MVSDHKERLKIDNQLKDIKDVKWLLSIGHGSIKRLQENSGIHMKMIIQSSIDFIVVH